MYQFVIDSDVNIIFINKAWAEEKKLPLWPLCNAIPIFNVNGIKNSAGNIIHCANITILYQGHQEKVIAKVMDLSKNQMILEFVAAEAQPWDQLETWHG